MDVKLFCGFPSTFWFPLFLPKDSVYLSSQSLCVLSLVMKNAYDGFGCTYIYTLLALSVCSCFPTATPTCTYIYVYTHRGLCALKMRFISLVKPPAGIIVLQPWHTGHTDSDSECGWLQPGLSCAQNWCPGAGHGRASPLSPSSAFALIWPSLHIHKLAAT